MPSAQKGAGPAATVTESGAVYTGTKRVVSATFLFRIARSFTRGRNGTTETEPRKRNPKTITGPKVDRSADGTLWGAKRLRVYALYDHFLISATYRPGICTTASPALPSGLV